MPNETPHDLREVWQSQHVEPKYMSLEEIRNKAAKFEGGVRSRNLRETVVGIGTIVVFLFYLKWFPTPLERAGSCLTIAGILWVIYRMNGRAAAAKVPEATGFETCVSFHRRELEHQRDLLRSIWRWYLGPLVPGIVLFSVSLIGSKVRPDHPGDWWRASPLLLLMVAWFRVTIWLNRRAADRMQKTIDELERTAEQ
ncbi:conserved membrane hypothetical protein [Candidatus Sulfopaludibacter sp. SbA3]|nr:conserved membrane hypothetical protein [Candidatus Sulfopaludibacter sp. SbA3]